MTTIASLYLQRRTAWLNDHIEHNPQLRKTSHLYLRDAAEVLKRIDIPSLKDYKVDAIIEKVVQIELAQNG